jgi:hypothetical protein
VAALGDGRVCQQPWLQRLVWLGEGRDWQHLARLPVQAAMGQPALVAGHCQLAAMPGEGLAVALV